MLLSLFLTLNLGFYLLSDGTCPKGYSFYNGLECNGEIVSCSETDYLNGPIHLKNCQKTVAHSNNDTSIPEITYEIWNDVISCSNEEAKRVCGSGSAGCDVALGENNKRIVLQRTCRCRDQVNVITSDEGDIFCATRADIRRPCTLSERNKCHPSFRKTCIALGNEILKSSCFPIMDIQQDEVVTSHGTLTRACSPEETLLFCGHSPADPSSNQEIDWKHWTSFTCAFTNGLVDVLTCPGRYFIRDCTASEISQHCSEMYPTGCKLACSLVNHTNCRLFGDVCDHHREATPKELRKICGTVSASLEMYTTVTSVGVVHRNLSECKSLLWRYHPSMHYAPTGCDRFIYNASLPGNGTCVRYNYTNTEGCTVYSTDSSTNYSSINCIGNSSNNALIYTSTLPVYVSQCGPYAISVDVQFNNNKASVLLSTCTCQSGYYPGDNYACQNTYYTRICTQDEAAMYSANSPVCPYPYSCRLQCTLSGVTETCFSHAPDRCLDTYYDTTCNLRDAQNYCGYNYTSCQGSCLISSNIAFDEVCDIQTCTASDGTITTPPAYPTHHQVTPPVPGFTTSTSCATQSCNSTEITQLCGTMGVDCLKICCSGSPCTVQVQDFNNRYCMCQNPNNEVGYYQSTTGFCGEGFLGNYCNLQQLCGAFTSSSVHVITTSGNSDVCNCKSGTHNIDSLKSTGGLWQCAGYTRTCSTVEALATCGASQTCDAYCLPYDHNTGNAQSCFPDSDTCTFTTETYSVVESSRPCSTIELSLCGDSALSCSIARNGTLFGCVCDPTTAFYDSTLSITGKYCIDTSNHVEACGTAEAGRCGYLNVKGCQKRLLLYDRAAFLAAGGFTSTAFNTITSAIAPTMSTMFQYIPGTGVPYSNLSYGLGYSDLSLFSYQAVAKTYDGYYRHDVYGSTWPIGVSADHGKTARFHPVPQGTQNSNASLSPLYTIDGIAYIDPPLLKRGTAFPGNDKWWFVECTCSDFHNPDQQFIRSEYDPSGYRGIPWVSAMNLFKTSHTSLPKQIVYPTSWNSNSVYRANIACDADIIAIHQDYGTVPYYDLNVASFMGSSGFASCFFANRACSGIEDTDGIFDTMQYPTLNQPGFVYGYGSYVFSAGITLTSTICASAMQFCYNTRQQNPTLLPCNGFGTFQNSARVPSTLWKGMDYRTKPPVSPVVTGTFTDQTAWDNSDYARASQILINYHSSFMRGTPLDVKCVAAKYPFFYNYDTFTYESHCSVTLSSSPYSLKDCGSFGPGQDPGLFVISNQANYDPDPFAESEPYNSYRLCVGSQCFTYDTTGFYTHFYDSDFSCGLFDGKDPLNVRSINDGVTTYPDPSPTNAWFQDTCYKAEQLGYDGILDAMILSSPTSCCPATGSNQGCITALGRAVECQPPPFNSTFSLKCSFQPQHSKISVGYSNTMSWIPYALVYPMSYNGPHVYSCSGSNITTPGAQSKCTLAFTYDNLYGADYTPTWPSSSPSFSIQLDNVTISLLQGANFTGVVFSNVTINTPAPVMQTISPSSLTCSCPYNVRISGQVCNTINDGAGSIRPGPFTSLSQYPNGYTFNYNSAFLNNYCVHGTYDPLNNFCNCVSPWYQSQPNLPCLFSYCPTDSNGVVCGPYGTCNILSGHCTCDAYHTYDTTGQVCTIAKNTLCSPTCSIHGACNSTGSCVCQADYNWFWNGTNCDIPNLRYPCLNGGQVVTDTNQGPHGLMCSCPSTGPDKFKYSGKQCEIYMCPVVNAQTCNGVGTCSCSGPGVCRCSCPNTIGSGVVNLWDGCGCEYNIQNYCVQNGTFTLCSAVSTTDTSILDYPIQTVARIPNYDNSACVAYYPPSITTTNNIGVAYQCVCPYQYTGEFCQTSSCSTPVGFPNPPQFACNNNPCVCAGRGNCNCSCSTEVSAGNRLYAGQYCETDVTSQCGTYDSQGFNLFICNNHGSCLKNTTTGAYGCVCNRGYMGQYCQATACAVDCGPYGACVIAQNTGVCACNPAYVFTNVNGLSTACTKPTCTGSGVPSSDGRSCVCPNNPAFALPGCTSLPCPVVNGYTCGPAVKTDALSSNGQAGNCQSNGICQCISTAYTFNSANNTCVAKCDIQNTATMTFNLRGFTGCVCKPGFLASANCANASCFNGGVFQISTLTCQCTAIWSGSSCSTSQCVHGTPAQNNTMCICSSGYSGILCDQVTCRNGGVWNPSSRSCACPSGFTGIDCGQTTNPCQHSGTAQPDGSCVCTSGWTGPYCQYAYCANGGVYAGSGLCLCVGRWGQDDSTGNCTMNECGRYGRPDGTDFNCICDYPSVYVPSASIAACQISCLNGGTWDVINQICNCTSAYAGYNCSIQVTSQPQNTTTNSTNTTTPTTPSGTGTIATIIVYVNSTYYNTSSYFNRTFFYFNLQYPVSNEWWTPFRIAMVSSAAFLFSVIAIFIVLFFFNDSESPSFTFDNIKQFVKKQLKSD